MENSIENIWREGFLHPDALIAPKLNDLYNQKSQHIVDRFKRMFAINLNGILIAASLFFVASFFAGVPILGTLLAGQLLALVIIGKKQSRGLEIIDKGGTSYQYLKAFDSWHKEAISVYARLYRILYPLLFITFMLGMWFANFNEVTRMKLQAEPDIDMIWGIPLWGIIGIGVFALLMGVFSGRLYKWDMKIVYGQVTQKLEELITDMEELRA